jgi:ribosomal protein S18 acetylase RimI-like enzyme
MATRVIERRGADALDEIASLWHALKNHHAECTPGIPVRGDDESWALRRSDYEGWLAQPGAFLLLAREDDRAVAYALVRIQEAGPTWLEPDRYAIVQDIAVAATARGGGIGRALLDRVYSESGCDVVELVMLSANASAKAFYERLGFEPFAETLRRRVKGETGVGAPQA